MRSMKFRSFSIAAILLVGSTFLLNNIYAHGHNDRSSNRMLFKGIDLTDEQRKEVRAIMSSSIKEGIDIRTEMREQSMDAMGDLKKGTHEKISAVLSEEQMAQFDKNSKRMEKRSGKMRDRKMQDQGKGKRNKKRHKGHKKKRR